MNARAQRLFDQCWNDVRRILMASTVPLTSVELSRVLGYSFAYLQDTLRAMRIRRFVKRSYHGQGPTRRVTYEWIDV